ncbi:MAG: aminopeptidase P family protein [Firmicutes bacterium]|nr:aminopeptidase P family protein [Bacillota bacterium]
MNYPVIPREEYPLRWKKVQNILVENDLDLILAYADDRATYGAAYGRYFADIPVHFENVLIMFTRDHDPILLVGPETDGYAQLRSTIRDIRVLAEFSAEDEDYPFSTVIPLKDIVADVVGDVKRVGLAAKIHMSATLYEAIQAALPGVEYTNIDKAIEEIRGIKTPAEIEVIRYAYKIADMGMEAAIKAIKPGVTEREVAAEAEYVMRKAGAEGYGIDPMVASGENTDHIIARTTMRKIKENDVVCVTLAPRYEGYHGACARTIVVGDPGEKFMKALKASIHAQEYCASQLNAGAMGSAVEQMGRDIMEEAGYGKNFMYSGLHSVGVTEFEPPILGPSSTTLIENNMVISIDIPLFEADVHGFRTESGYLIQDGKAQILTEIPYLIQK